MPAVVFWRKLSREDRRALDEEIRRRNFADCAGIAEWLTARGHPVKKSPMAKYIRRLRIAENIDASALDPAVLELATHLYRAALALKKAMDRA